MRYEVKQKMVDLAGACFWFWDSFYGFLDSSGVPQATRLRYPRESFNKYQTMRNVLADLENAENTEVINSLISNFFRLRRAVDKDHVDAARAKALLEEFREVVGDDPIERRSSEGLVERTRRLVVSRSNWLGTGDGT